MSKGIFTAVSGAIAQTAKLDTIANNLANVNTPAFKRDSQIFKEYVTAYEKEPTSIQVPRVPASIESFYDMQGGDKSYVDLDGTNTDFSQGFLKSTGNPLDVALEGDGFFEVLTPQGPRLTRAGSFAVDGEGKLVTKQGYPVLKEGAPGSEPEGRFIQTKGNKPITVSDNGEIFEDNQSLGKFSLLSVSNKDGLQKVGENMYTLRQNLKPDVVPATLLSSKGARVTQGFIEGSNVNPIREMTDMIATSRTFESTQKAIQAYDDMQKKLVTEVPKLG